MGERAERLKHILEISGDSSSVQTQSYDTSQTLPRKLSHTDVSSHSYSRLSATSVKNDSIPSPVKNGKPFEYNARRPTVTPVLSTATDKKKEEVSESYNWRENLVKMRQQIKAVNDLPTIDVPEPIKTNHKYRGSFSTPDLSQFSDKPRWSCESSWEIRAKYRSMRTEELCQGQLIKKSGYSWRDKVPEIQKPLKFSEVRSNAVTDAAFIGSSYVRDKEQNFNSSDQKLNEKSKAQIMTKIYRIDSSVDIMKLVIRDNINPHFQQETPIKYEKLAHNKDASQADNVLLERLWQMLNFFNYCWQLKLCHPGFDLSRDVAKIIAAAKIMETIMEVDEIPDLEDVKKTEDPAGDIKSKMTGAIAGLQLVKKKAPEKAPMKNDSKVSAGGASGDWRSEIKKRERAKQQEKLNAMPLGMPDYREPEKPQIVDWREKLKKEAENDNPMNKWKKFDSGVKKTVRPPPQKPKPKPSKAPKEDPCTCNVGNCKIHSKFAFGLKSTAKKSTPATTDQNNNKTDEPMKRRTSVRKRQQESQSSLKRSDSNQSLASSKQTDLKKVKTESRAGSRASSAAPEDTEMVEVIKIINFVAIKMTMKASDVKKTDNCTIVSPPPPIPSHPPPPVPKDDSPSQQSPQKSSSKSLTPSPPREPSPPPRIATPPPPPPRTPTPPPPKEPSPVQEAIKPIEKVVTKPEQTPSPVYQRKFFPNPEPSEPYKPKVWDYTPNTVKLKRTKEFYVEEPVIRRQFSNDIEVAPVKFSSSQDNCVKKALFVGNAYLGGDNISEFQV